MFHVGYSFYKIVDAKKGATAVDLSLSRTGDKLLVKTDGWNNKHVRKQLTKFLAECRKRGWLRNGKLFSRMGRSRRHSGDRLCSLLLDGLADITVIT